MRVVHAQGTAAETVAEPDPGADSLGPPCQAIGRLVGRLLEPERPAVELLESTGVEVDGAMLSGRAAVIPADADPAMARQLSLQELQLPVEGLLHAEDVRRSGLEGCPEGHLAYRPAVPRPARASL